MTTPAPKLFRTQTAGFGLSPLPISTRTNGRKRKIPREVRQHLYQMELTLRETDSEIRRVLADYGFTDAGARYQRTRIRRERGK